MKIELELNEKEQASLIAAVVEHYHKMKSAAADTTFGGLITDEDALISREVWRKAEEQIGLGEWT